MCSNVKTGKTFTPEKPIENGLFFNFFPSINELFLSLNWRVFFFSLIDGFLMIAEKFVVQIPAESYISLTSSFDFWFDEMEEAEQLTFFLLRDVFLKPNRLLSNHKSVSMKSMLQTRINLITVFFRFRARSACEIEKQHWQFYPQISAPPFQYSFSENISQTKKMRYILHTMQLILLVSMIITISFRNWEKNSSKKYLLMEKRIFFSQS